MKKTLLIFKALSDQSRLRIVNALKDGPLYVELLSERLQLAPSTISFHLKKLEEARLVTSQKEQYYVVYTLDEAMLHTTLLDLVAFEDSEAKLQEERENQYRQSVLGAFFEHGKLISIPVQQKKRRIILEELAKAFKSNQCYTEREVNIIIADFNDDFCTLRKALVTENLLTREDNKYKKV